MFTTLEWTVKAKAVDGSKYQISDFWKKMKLTLEPDFAFVIMFYDS